MTEQEAYKAVIEYRSGLIKYGQMYIQENPDKLTRDECEALLAKIFGELNRIDMQFGYEYHNTGHTIPKGISPTHLDYLFHDFLDWYNVIPTPSNYIYSYVLKNYPVESFSKILCVGDGQNCHLGRKLAANGYMVVSVDPEARREFSFDSGKSGGKLRIAKECFSRKSEEMIDWADLIVGSKVPQIAEELVGLRKPTLFSISTNAEIYKMRFKGTFIKSSDQLSREIAKCPGVTVRTLGNGIRKEELFECDGKVIDKVGPEI